MVRRVDRRTVYLTAGAVEVFDAERKRDAEELANGERRRGWLRLATSVGAPAARTTKLEASAPTTASVDAARGLYVSTVEAAVRAARKERRWIDLWRMRREQAAALYADAGSPVPPPEDIVALQRDALLGVLRSFGAKAKVVELVSAGCCRICRADDERVFRIVDELRTPRLPHEGCPKGICGCDWWLTTPEPKRKRRRTKRSRPA